MYLQRDTAILFVTVNCLINGVGSIEVVRGDTATIVCDIAGTFVSPSWDDGTSTTVYIAESQTMFNPSTTDSRWSRSSDTKNLIITSIEDSDVGTYRCSILTPITDSYTATLTVTNQTAGLDGTCSNTAPIIECSTENAECSATNKCECKTGYEPNAAATECICDCKVLKIVWSVLFIVFSTGSGAWILYVLFAVPKARKWLTEKLCAPTHLCMIGWIFVSLVYSIIAVILYNILVCKDESSEADCWPVYVIIGIVVKGGDVAVSLLALLAFLNG